MVDDNPPEEIHHTEGTSGKWILLALAILYVAGSLFFLFSLRSRVDQLGKQQTTSNSQIGDLTRRLESAEAENEALGRQVGMTGQ